MIASPRVRIRSMLVPSAASLHLGRHLPSTHGRWMAMSVAVLGPVDVGSRWWGSHPEIGAFVGPRPRSARSRTLRRSSAQTRGIGGGSVSAAISAALRWGDPVRMRAWGRIDVAPRESGGARDHSAISDRDVMADERVLRDLDHGRAAATPRIVARRSRPRRTAGGESPRTGPSCAGATGHGDHKSVTRSTMSRGCIPALGVSGSR